MKFHICMKHLNMKSLYEAQIEAHRLMPNILFYLLSKFL